jgi:drug/metabolite transporter (DMT)-like permease
MDWLALSLTCAFSLASADAATKAWLRDFSTQELVLVRFTLTGIILIPLLVGMPSLDTLPLAFWAWIAVLVPLEIAAMLLYMTAIRDHPLSLTLPYLAFTPVFVILVAYLLLGERLTPRGVAGVALVVCGAWLLNVRHARRDDWRSWIEPLRAIFYEPGSRLMLVVAAIYALTSTLGKGAMQYLAPRQFGAFYFVLLGLASLVVFGLPQPGRLLRALGLVRAERGPGAPARQDTGGSRIPRVAAVFAVAGLNAVMIYTHFLALQQVEVAYMISVKRTSLLFGILYGALIFHEKDLVAHLPAAVLMLAGVALIALT